MYRYSIILLVFACCILAVEGRSQAPDSTTFVVIYKGVDSEFVPKSQRLDSGRWQSQQAEILDQLRRSSYWLSSIDDVEKSGDTLLVTIYQGRKVDQFQVANMEELITDIHYHSNQNWDKMASPDHLMDNIDRVLLALENQGYPFASVEIDSSEMVGDMLRLRLQIDKGSLVTYDSLSASPSGLIKPLFLAKYLKIEYDQHYREEDIADIEGRLQKLSFVELMNVKTTFQLKRAKVEIELAPLKVNRFDGILGIAPEASGNGVALTGQLDLSIKNLFHSAKELDINWLKPNTGSQQLHASYLHPLLLGSPLDFYFSIDQLRQDTTYSNRSLVLALDLHPSRYFSTRIQYESKLGNSLEDNSGENGNFNINYYGMSLTWRKLDHIIYPKNGVELTLSSNIGVKEVDNPASPTPNSTQYAMGLNITVHKKLNARSVFFFKSNNGLIINDYLYLNDLYRVGGLQTIRGFNELEFFASRYAILNFEWRYYIDAKSYLVAFYDQGFLMYDVLNGTYHDQPSGIGAGMNFSTDSGLFSLLYGLGRRDGQAFSFDSSKLHFGYTAFF